MESLKSIKVKPLFYANCYEKLKETAHFHGYNLLIHGSMNRDLDLVAIPWIDNPSSHLLVLQDFQQYLTGKHFKRIEDYAFSLLPGNRYSYIINLNRGSQWNNYDDKQYYLDISFTPLALPNTVTESDKVNVDFVQTVKNALKTRQGWENSGLNLDEYLKYPCEIDEDLALYIGECVPPQYLNKGLTQGGDCEYHEESYDDFTKIGFYMTTSCIDNRYFYLGILPQFRS